MRFQNARGGQATSEAEFAFLSERENGEAGRLKGRTGLSLPRAHYYDLNIPKLSTKIDGPRADFRFGLEWSEWPGGQ